MLPAQPAAQKLHVPPEPDGSVANIFHFRSSTAAHAGESDNVFVEERLCKTVSSINPDHIRSQTETRIPQVEHFDPSVLNRGSTDAAHRASNFSMTNNASQMFSTADN